MTTALYITVGMPGCGKSTLAQRLMDSRYIDKIISSDQIRVELFGDINEMGHNPEVFDLLHQRVREYLVGGLDVLVDATNLNPIHRNKLRQIALQCESHAIALLMHASITECLDRQERRGRTIPMPVMQEFERLYRECSTVEQLALEGWVVTEYHM